MKKPHKRGRTSKPSADAPFSHESNRIQVEQLRSAKIDLWINLNDSFARGRAVQNPGDLGVYLQDVFLVRAKSLHARLKSTPAGAGIKLMQVQEAIAKCMGMSNTHGLQQLCDEIHETLGPITPAERIAWLEGNPGKAKLLFGLFKLSHDFSTQKPIDVGPSEFLGALAAQLSHHLLGEKGSDEQTIVRPMKDAIAAAWIGSEDWDGSLSAAYDLTGSTEPLVGFRVWPKTTFQDETGAFHWSQHAGAILEDLAELSEAEESGPEAGLDSPYVQLKIHTLSSLVERNPELIGAWSELARLSSRKGDQAHAIDLLERGIAHTEKLIPKSFKGPIERMDSSNRDYHDAMRYLFDLYAGNPALQTKTLRLCNRMVGLNKGVGDAPLLSQRLMLTYAVKSEGKEVQRLVDRLEPMAQPITDLYIGATQILMGNGGGALQLVLAVHLVPAFREWILCGDETPVYDEVETGGRIRFRYSWNDLATLSATMKVFPQFGVWMRSFMKDEAHDKAIRSGFGDDLSRGIEKLALGLLSRHPVPSEFLRSGL